jgi:hypothetical protein
MPKYHIHLFTDSTSAFTALQLRRRNHSPKKKSSNTNTNTTRELLLQCGKLIPKHYLTGFLQNSTLNNKKNSNNNESSIKGNIFWLMSFAEDINMDMDRRVRNVPAWFGGYLVGHVYPHFLYIDLVCSKYKQGYKLINAAIHLGASLGVNTVQLSAIPQQIPYYKAIGFRRTPDACARRRNMETVKTLQQAVLEALKLPMGHESRMRPSTPTPAQPFTIQYTTTKASKNTVQVNPKYKTSLKTLLSEYNYYKNVIGATFYTLQYHNNRYIDDGFIMSLCVKKEMHRLAQAYNNVTKYYHWNIPASWHFINLNNLPHYYSSANRNRHRTVAVSSTTTTTHQQPLPRQRKRKAVERFTFPKVVVSAKKKKKKSS